jgi:photosystem II stability/assembly factor-like uncharacterized protein
MVNLVHKGRFKGYKLSLMLKVLFNTLLAFQLCSIGCEGSKIKNNVSTTSQRNDDSKITWENIPQIKSATFYSDNCIWIVTAHDGALLFSNNGGVNWNKLSIPANTRFEVVSFIDIRQGWAVDDNGRVWRTSDGGQTWIMLYKFKADAADHEFISALQVYFADRLYGWIVETYSIWYTTDGGLSWQKGSYIHDKQEGQPLRGYFLNKDVAWVGGTMGEVYRTRDGGKTWSVQTVAKGAAFAGVFLLNEQAGWLSDSNSKALYRTEDGGISWQPVSIMAEDISINSIYFTDAKDGWAVGQTLINHRSKSGVVFHTLDGGQHWEIIHIGENDPFFDSVYFADNKTGWLFARDRIYFSDNGGKDWTISLNLPPIE